MTEPISMTRCFGSAPRWSDYGVPCPAISSFGYQIDAGLIRTQMDSGYARQRRRYTHRPTTYQLTWTLTTGQLHAWEALLDRAYNWLYVPMVTGQVPDWMSVNHLIRFTGNPTISLQAKDLWQVSVTAEQYKINAECVLEQMCDELTKCLSSFAVAPSSGGWPEFAKGWGDRTDWSNPNG